MSGLCVFTDISDFLDLKTVSKMLLKLGSHKIPQSVRNLPPPPPLQSPGVKGLIYQLESDI